MRNRAFSIYSAFGGSGFSLGLVLSGLLTAVSWRWPLLVPAPVALIVLAAGWWLIPRDARETGKAAAKRRSFDLPGAFTVTFSMLLLVYTVVSAQQAGWTSSAALARSRSPCTGRGPPSAASVSAGFRARSRFAARPMSSTQ